MLAEHTIPRDRRNSVRKVVVVELGSVVAVGSARVRGKVGKGENCLMEKFKLRLVVALDEILQVYDVCWGRRK